LTVLYHLKTTDPHQVNTIMVINQLKRQATGSTI